jgi:hypothetical protein
MTSEGLVEMFEGDSAEPCAGKFPRAERRVSRAQAQERGTLLPLAEIIDIFLFLSKHDLKSLCGSKNVFKGHLVMSNTM